MPEGLISGKFNEEIRMKRFWSYLRRLQRSDLLEGGEVKMRDIMAISAYILKIVDKD